MRKYGRKKKDSSNTQNIIQPQSPPFTTQSSTTDLETLQREASEPGFNFGDISIFAPNRPKTQSPIQAKLTIGVPGDKYEQEADRVAHQVVSQINAPIQAKTAL